jgi:hypothetical protein
MDPSSLARSHHKFFKQAPQHQRTASAGNIDTSKKETGSSANTVMRRGSDPGLSSQTNQNKTEEMELTRLEKVADTLRRRTVRPVTSNEKTQLTPR